MKIDEYWSKFGKYDQEWHYLVGSLYALVSIVSLITNGFVLFYLIK